MPRKMIQTGSAKFPTIGTWTGSLIMGGLSVNISLRLVCIGTPNAAENGLVIVKAANCFSDIEPIFCRYISRPIGTTKRASKVRYVRTIADEVRRASDEHISPTVDVARQVIAMIAR